MWQAKELRANFSDVWQRQDLGEERWHVRRFEGWNVREAESEHTEPRREWQEEIWRGIFVATLIRQTSI